MGARIAVSVDSGERHAEALVDFLVDRGPMTSADICQGLGWSRGRFTAALRHARENLCPELEMVIPNPTPQNGWLYQVTTEWQPVEAGASHALGHVESRLRSLYRDVSVILPHLERGSREWRRANFLSKHLSHITSTLDEISGKG